MAPDADLRQSDQPTGIPRCIDEADGASLAHGVSECSTHGTSNTPRLEGSADKVTVDGLAAAPSEMPEQEPVQAQLVVCSTVPEPGRRYIDHPAAGGVESILPLGLGPAEKHEILPEAAELFDGQLAERHVSAPHVLHVAGFLPVVELALAERLAAAHAGWPSLPEEPYRTADAGR